MSRVSRAQAEKNRERVISAAARLYREQGVRDVTVMDLMKPLGLTHGAFYKQFDSRDALVTEATAQAFKDLGVLLAEYSERHADRTAARGDLVDYYLSTEHRDDVGAGCPTTGFARDMAGDWMPEEARQRYSEGVRDFARWLDDDEEDGLARLASLVGALVVARATAGTPLSEEVLAAVRHQQAADGETPAASGEPG
jgi:TetR/AcrR family transcriptional repressor of nem operon